MFSSMSAQYRALMRARGAYAMRGMPRARRAVRRYAPLLMTTNMRFDSRMNDRFEFTLRCVNATSTSRELRVYATR